MEPETEPLTTVLMDLDAAPIDRPAAYLDAQRSLALVAARLTAAVATACRREWAMLDAAGDPPVGAPAPVIDPEALLLASAWLAPHDRTLAATTHAWVSRWSDLLSVQRTRNLARAFPPSVEAELRNIAVTAYERGKDFRWAPLVKGAPAAPATDTAADDTDTAAAATGGVPCATRLPVHHTALLMLRLRMAFGVGARPDALAYLLARDSAWSAIADIAQATGYTTSAIRRALDRMAAARIVSSADDGACRYRCDVPAWAALFSLHERVEPWPYRLQGYAFVAQCVTLADGLARRKLTAYAITEAVRGLARSVRISGDGAVQRAWDDAFREGSALPEMERALLHLAAALHWPAQTDQGA
ncbi:MAG: hypothetical protein IT355_02570 [Gemmatimonadaceae bacterium]|nr:hypothetical protein [Gemmatimonadaceae bacterium]